MYVLSIIFYHRGTPLDFKVAPHHQDYKYAKLNAKHHLKCDHDAHFYTTLLGVDACAMSLHCCHSRMHHIIVFFMAMMAVSENTASI